MVDSNYHLRLGPSALFREVPAFRLTVSSKLIKYYLMTIPDLLDHLKPYPFSFEIELTVMTRQVTVLAISSLRRDKVDSVASACLSHQIY